MSWTDLKAIENFSKLSKEFNISTLVETGTFRAQGARVMSSIFKQVLSCEINTKYYRDACYKTMEIPNVKVIHQDSTEFLSFISATFKEPLLYYLDAHFYDASLPKEERFTVKKELQSIQPNNNSIIIIHDFDTKNGLGHLIYDDIHLDFNIVKEELQKINNNFNYYVNYKEACKIVTANDFISRKLLPLELDSENIDSLDFIWSHPFKTYRGILYCIPKELNLLNYELYRVYYDEYINYGRNSWDRVINC